nr:MAG TPA: hypothetical protein [Caudoviricetes sp.]
MKIKELLLNQFKSKERKVFKKIFVGNRIYYVDRYGNPHNGIVMYTNGQKIGVGYLTNYTGPDSEALIKSNMNPTGAQDIVDLCDITKTAEVLAGEVGKKCRWIKGRSKENLKYKNMPKAEFSTLKIYPGMFIKIVHDNDLYILENSFADDTSSIVRYTMRNAYGKVVYPAFPIYNRLMKTKDENVKIDSALGMKMTEEGKILISQDMVDEIWEPDVGYSFQTTLFNTDHMSPIYKRGNHKC